ncbi:MAG TPA: hypothetical protein VG897_02995 [Terriglobales bacterium]|nr:hypothetical protein [Terriglobales bacterium]
MQADFSVELTEEDPTLALPWTDPEGRWRYYDLRKYPEQIANLEEVQSFPPMREFLSVVNSISSNLQSAKCDAWFSNKMTEEDEPFGASCKFGCYVDLAFHQQVPQMSLPLHEAFAVRLVDLVKRAPELPASMEIIIRRAHFEDDTEEIREGYYFTTYVFGYGEDEAEARQSCGITLRLVGHAALQISTGRGTSVHTTEPQQS